MANESGVRLHNVSVVVTAENHNPSILNPDFLVSCEIVPADWSVAETLTTPALSVVKYRNGITWTVDPFRLTITENCGPAFEDHYEIHSLATIYLEKISQVPYRGLGLNCQVSILQDDPKRWLVDRFAVGWLRNNLDVLGLTPTLTLNAKRVECNITFKESKWNDISCVVAECNFHHALLLNVDDFREAITRWPEHKSFLFSMLDKLLLTQNT